MVEEKPCTPALSGRRVGPPDRRKQGPIQFLKNNPIQSSFWVRFMCPKTRRNWLRLPIVRFHPGSSCPQAAALRQSHTRGRRPPPFPRDHALVGIRSTFAVPHLAQSSEHPNTFTSFRRPTLECSDVRLGWQETRKRVLELRRPVTVPREICSLGRMNDDRTDLEVFQQCRDLVFGDWTSAAIFVQLRVWIGEKLLHHLLRCYLRAVLGKHRPQCREELNSYAGFIWSTREVNRGPTRLLAPTTTCMLRNLQRQFPIGTQPIVKTWRLRRL